MVAQHLPDLGQPGPMAQQFAGYRVTKPVRSQGGSPTRAQAAWTTGNGY